MSADVLRRFVDMTGDVDTGHRLLARMHDLIVATGASVEDLMSAAADIANQLGNVPNKAQGVESVMRHMCWTPKTPADVLTRWAEALRFIG